MFTASSEFYDLIYSTFKDYSAETAWIASELRRLNPRCRSILDIACGTGEHARLLRSQGFEVDGVDLDPAFVRIASEKNPGGRFIQGDMSDFHLSRQYDAVLCLFSSIAYLQTMERVRRALTCFREHLAPGGAIVVEPWFGPGVLDPQRVTRNTGEANGVRVSRVTRVEVDGNLSRLLFDLEITDATGTRHASEVHTLGLFAPADMLRAFEELGLHADYDPNGLSGRGLYVATVAG
jgi:SAM-dependent methyltransferase